MSSLKVRVGGVVEINIVVLQAAETQNHFATSQVHQHLCGHGLFLDNLPIFLGK